MSALEYHDGWQLNGRRQFAMWVVSFFVCFCRQAVSSLKEYVLNTFCLHPSLFYALINYTPAIGNKKTVPHYSLPGTWPITGWGRVQKWVACSQALLATLYGANIQNYQNNWRDLFTLQKGIKCLAVKGTDLPRISNKLASLRLGISKVLPVFPRVPKLKLEVPTRPESPRAEVTKDECFMFIWGSFCYIFLCTELRRICYK